MAAPAIAQNTAITIGNFDGAHVGHAALVRAARAFADQASGSGRVIVLCFDPNPLTVLRPGATPPPRLTSFAQRSRLLKTIGADEVIALRPTPEFLGQSPEAFIASCVKQWSVGAFVEGPDFRFGRDRAGSIDTLHELEKSFGHRTIVVDPVDVELRDLSVVRASSSMTRWLIAHGRMCDAAAVLGHAYELEAAIVQGDQRGRTIGFPTANLATIDQLLPADGIYAGWAERDDGRTWAAGISVGTKPTFGDRPRTCEAYLIDYDGPVNDYGWNIRLRFTHWIRDQLTYSNVDALIAQLHNDVAQVRVLAARSEASAAFGTASHEPQRT